MSPRAAIATNDSDGLSRPLPFRAGVRGRALKPLVLSNGRNSTRLTFAAAQISSEVCKVCPDGRFVDRIGIEVGIIPFDHALVVKMAGIRDRLQKGLIAHWSADIRRRTATLSADEARIIDIGRRYRHRLQLDRVSPIFPVHVVVAERL